MFFIMAVIMAVVEKESSSSHIQVNKASGASGETKRSHGSPAASNEESDYD